MSCRNLGCESRRASDNRCERQLLSTTTCDTYGKFEYHTHTHTHTIVFSTSPRRNENRHESILLDDSDYNEILYTSICFCLHPPPLPVTHTRTPPPKHEHYGFIMSLPSLPHVPSLSKADGGSNILSPFSKCALFSMNAMECTL